MKNRKINLSSLFPLWTFLFSKTENDIFIFIIGIVIILIAILIIVEFSDVIFKKYKSYDDNSLKETEKEDQPKNRKSSDMFMEETNAQGSSLERKFPSIFLKGEELVAFRLKSLEKKYNGKLINNCIITDSYGRSSEIDHILILPSGIYVIETKDLSGYIYGNEEAEKWIQKLDEGCIRHEHYNPIKQNQTHVKKLKYILKQYENVYSCIVFTKANIRHVEADNVFDISSLIEYITEDTDNIVFTQSQINIFYLQIKNNFERNHVDIKSHVDSMYKKIIYCQYCGTKLERTEDIIGKKLYCPKCHMTYEDK